MDTTIILHAGSGFKTYRWQNGSADSTYTVNKQGVYWVSVTAQNGCTYSDTVDIQVICYSKSVFIPNVFTPGNSNSICDAYFRLEGRCIGKAELTIFNRWEIRYTGMLMIFQFPWTTNRVMMRHILI